MGLGSTSRNKTASAAGLAPLPFVKMHGLGNDFLLLDRRARQEVRPLPAALVPPLGERRSGVGFHPPIALDSPGPAPNYEQGAARVPI